MDIQLQIFCGNLWLFTVLSYLGCCKDWSGKVPKAWSDRPWGERKEHRKDSTVQLLVFHWQMIKQEHFLRDGNGDTLTDLLSNRCISFIPALLFSLLSVITAKTEAVFWKMLECRHFKFCTSGMLSYHKFINRHFFRKLTNCVGFKRGEYDNTSWYK